MAYLLANTGDILVTADGDRLLLAGLVGTASGSGGASASLHVQPSLVGAAAGQGGASGALSQLTRAAARRFVVAQDGVDRLTVGTRNVVARSTFDGSGIGFGLAPSGYYGTGVQLAGDAAGHAGATAVPGQLQGLAGTAAGDANATGAIDSAGMEGAASGDAEATGQLSQHRPLSGTADGHAGAVATGPQVPVPLSGTAAGDAEAAGVAGQVPLRGTAAGRADASATLTQVQPLAGTAAGRATAAAAQEGWEATPEPVVELALLGPAVKLASLPSPSPDLDVVGPVVTLRIRAESP